MKATLPGKAGCHFFLLSSIVSARLVAAAQPATEAEQIRQELRQLKQDYQQRIDRLEQRLRNLDNPAGRPTITNPPAPLSAFGKKPVSPPVETSAPTNAAAVAARQFANEQYQRDVEWREGVRFADSPFRERIEQVLQDTVELHGYFRAGYGRDDKGGP